MRRPYTRCQHLTAVNKPTDIQRAYNGVNRVRKSERIIATACKEQRHGLLTAHGDGQRTGITSLAKDAIQTADRE